MKKNHRVTETQRRKRATQRVAPTLCLCASVVILFSLFTFAFAEDPAYHPQINPASDEGEKAIKKFKIADGFKIELFAAEPMLANPVCFCLDNKGRFYVGETFRLYDGVLDMRTHRLWLDDDLASRTVADRLAAMKKNLGESFADYDKQHERIRLLEDTDGDGKADRAVVYADGFNHAEDGVGAGLLADQGDIYYTCIPDLWKLRDTDGDGKADERKSLSTGYGVHFNFLGHDLHGLRKGPDGKLYFSIGDRGAHIETEGRVIDLPDTGAVFRCNPDGSQLEPFCTGLRNPQELVFDDYGNLFTGDNNSDAGDKARLVYCVEGGDSGWRIGYQWIEKPVQRGPWNGEKIWHLPWKGQAAYIVPPVAHVAAGPAGFAFYPGTGMPERYKDHFFLCDFRGGAGISLIHTFKVQPKGASFEMTDREDFLKGSLVTDVDFGAEGGIYWTDWTEGWDQPHKGRLYHAFDPAVKNDPLVKEAKEILAGNLDRYSDYELGELLAHQDQRVRFEAQYELARRDLRRLQTGRDSDFMLFGTLGTIAFISPQTYSEEFKNSWTSGEYPDAQARALLQLAEKCSRSPWARLHAIWGIGEVLSKLGPKVEPKSEAVAQSPQDKEKEFQFIFSLVVSTLISGNDLKLGPEGEKAAGELLGKGLGEFLSDPRNRGEAVLVECLKDENAEIRAQAIKVLSDIHSVILNSNESHLTELLDLLKDASLRVRFFTAMSLGKIVNPGVPAMPPSEEIKTRYISALAEMLRENNDADPYLRHAGVMGLVGIGDAEALLKHADDESSAVRMGILLALRRMQKPEIARFLKDRDPALVSEAAHAINDVPIADALPELAGMIGQSENILKMADADVVGKPVMLRILNANFRLGGAENAKAIAEFASRSEPPEVVRLEALGELKDWASPSGRDRVIGVWRPLPKRDPETAARALRPILPELLRSAPNKILQACAQLAGQYQVAEAGAPLFALLSDAKKPTEARVEALRALGEFEDPNLAKAVNLARADAADALRNEGNAQLAKLDPAGAASVLATALNGGSILEKQGALATLADLEGAQFDQLLSTWLDSLAAKKVPAEIQLDLLEAAQKHPNDEIKMKLARYQSAISTDDPLGGFRESLFGGNAERGEKIFFEKTEVTCQKCHTVKSKVGGEVGPELPSVGTRKGREYILESILHPNAQIAEGFENVTLTMKDGKEYAGRVLEEEGNQILLEIPVQEEGEEFVEEEDAPKGTEAKKDEKEDEKEKDKNEKWESEATKGPRVTKMTLPKDQIVSRQHNLSSMPEDISENLAKSELRDLVEFISTLK